MKYIEIIKLVILICIFVLMVFLTIREISSDSRQMSLMRDAINQELFIEDYEN